MRCFVTHGQPISSILFWIVRICRSVIKCSYLKNEKLFPSFLFHLWNLHQILNILKETKILIANVFLKLHTAKDFFWSLSKKRHFRTSFASQHVKGSQRLAKSAWEHFYHIFPSLWREIIRKISPLLKFEITGVLVNTLNADYRSPVPDSHNLSFPIQMQLS